jgi:hypothetical protein
MANVQIKYGVEHGKLVLRAAHTQAPCDPPRFGVILDVCNEHAVLTAHARCLEHVAYEGPVRDLPADWKEQTVEAIDALDEAWAVGP